MPKIRKSGTKAKQATYNPYPVNDSSSNGTNDVTSLSKGQKKRHDKKQKVMQKLGIVPNKLVQLQAKNKAKNNRDDEKEKLLFSNLEVEMKKVLENSANENGGDAKIQAAANQKVTNKFKKAVAIREAERMRLVQNHPIYNENPILATQMHIEQMLKNKTRNNHK